MLNTKRRTSDGSAVSVFSVSVSVRVLSRAACLGEAAEAKWVLLTRAAPPDEGGVPSAARNKRTIPYANTYMFSVLSS